MKRIFLLAMIFLMVACAPTQESQDVPPLSTPEPVSTPTDIPSAQTDPVPAAPDAFSLLPEPACDGGPTPPQAEGPYYTPDTPERNSLLEEGTEGERLILIGYVLDSNCQPIANAWLDFWQAGADGEYDNAGYRLRGHQFTDEQGRYYLETVMPGLYSSRPIRHIHVKIQPPNGEVLITQLYFPDQPIENLTVELIPQDGYQLGLFNFVVRR